MSKITVLNDKAIAVEIPPDTRRVEIMETGESSFLSYWFRGEEDYDWGSEELPPGSWSILGKGNELREDQWKGIVDWHTDSNDSSYDPQYNVTTYFDVFKDYVTGDEAETAIESGLSLLKSKGLNPSEVIILIKK